MPNFISENQIEQALVQKLQYLHGFDALDCYTENAEDLNDGSNRANKRDVILLDKVREAAIRLNPDIPPTAIEDALDKLWICRCRFSGSQTAHLRGSVSAGGNLTHRNKRMVDIHRYPCNL